MRLAPVSGAAHGARTGTHRVGLAGGLSHDLSKLYEVPGMGRTR